MSLRHVRIARLDLQVAWRKPLQEASALDQLAENYSLKLGIIVRSSFTLQLSKE
jgi:hypothetical protein